MVRLIDNYCAASSAASLSPHGFPAPIASYHPPLPSPARFSDLFFVLSSFPSSPLPLHPLALLLLTDRIENFQDNALGGRAVAEGETGVLGRNVPKVEQVDGIGLHDRPELGGACEARPLCVHVPGSGGGIERVDRGGSREEVNRVGRLREASSPCCMLRAACSRVSQLSVRHVRGVCCM